jgi:phenylalanyl-tRNA synthetase beta subunit
VNVAEKVELGAWLKSIQQMDSPFLEKITLWDVYRSESLPVNTKNVTFHMVYRSWDQTLSVAQVETEHAKVTQYALTCLEL